MRHTLLPALLFLVACHAGNPLVRPDDPGNPDAAYVVFRLVYGHGETPLHFGNYFRERMRRYVPVSQPIHNYASTLAITSPYGRRHKLEVQNEWYILRFEDGGSGRSVYLRELQAQLTYSGSEIAGNPFTELFTAERSFRYEEVRQGETTVRQEVPIVRFTKTIPIHTTIAVLPRTLVYGGDLYISEDPQRPNTDLRCRWEPGMNDETLRRFLSERYLYTGLADLPRRHRPMQSPCQS